jgi:hypothetical protein
VKKTKGVKKENSKIYSSTSRPKDRETINTSNISNHSISRIEHEMEKRVKTILRRNIVGRYKKSPYINKI